MFVLGWTDEDLWEVCPKVLAHFHYHSASRPVLMVRPLNGLPCTIVALGSDGGFVSA